MIFFMWNLSWFAVFVLLLSFSLKHHLHLPYSPCLRFKCVNTSRKGRGSEAMAWLEILLCELRLLMLQQYFLFNQSSNKCCCQVFSFIVPLSLTRINSVHRTQPPSNPRAATFRAWAGHLYMIQVFHRKGNSSPPLISTQSKSMDMFNNQP